MFPPEGYACRPGDAGAVVAVSVAVVLAVAVVVVVLSSPRLRFLKALPSGLVLLVLLAASSARRPGVHEKARDACAASLEVGKAAADGADNGLLRSVLASRRDAVDLAIVVCPFVVCVCECECAPIRHQQARHAAGMKLSRIDHKQLAPPSLAGKISSSLTPTSNPCKSYLRTFACPGTPRAWAPTRACRRSTAVMPANHTPRRLPRRSLSAEVSFAFFSGVPRLRSLPSPSVPLKPLTATGRGKKHITDDDELGKECREDGSPRCSGTGIGALLSFLRPVSGVSPLSVVEQDSVTRPRCLPNQSPQPVFPFTTVTAPILLSPTCVPS